MPLTLTAVAKHYRTVTAVDDLSFAVARGEIVALLGPNGAGKTTTVRMINRIIAPDSGTITIDLPGVDGPVRPDLGYLPEERGLYPDQPIARTLTMFGRLRGMSRRDARAATTAWLERFDLADRATEKLSALSKGNQQKVQFAASILHRPKLAILDEPFSGLDPVNQDAFLELLRELRADGMTILLSAHQMALVERVADRILIMNRGRLVRSGTLDELQAHVGHALRLTVRTTDAPALLARPSAPPIERVDARDDGTVVVIGTDGAPLNDVLGALTAACPLTDVTVGRRALHDIYVEAVTADGGRVDAPKPDVVPDEEDAP